MKTNYQNLTAFETAAVAMVLLGLALIGLQVWVVLPDEARTDIVDAVQILDARKAWNTQLAVNEFVFGGMDAFLQQFSIAAVEVFQPVVDNTRVVAGHFRVAFESFTALSDTLASNYKNNYVQPGVEAGMGGKVLGAYLEKLAEQVVPAQN